MPLSNKFFASLKKFSLAKLSKLVITKIIKRYFRNSEEHFDGTFKFDLDKKSYDASLNNITIEKGSITVNGVSLTVINSERNQFSVAIIPYTFEHTNFKLFKTGDMVNLEFDVLGKYVQKLHSLQN